LNWTAVAAHQQVASYWHMLPTAVQGRHVVWDAIDPSTGVRVIDQVWPKELRARVNNTDMSIHLKNGSIWQVVGSDNYDRLVGANVLGVVFSEYSISDPRAWDFIRPILAENGGWALFIYTPRGKNHGHDLYKMAVDNPDWFAERLDIEDTFRNDGSSVITQEMYQAEIDAGMDPQLALQEFYCSFDAGLFGAYYTDQLKRCKVGDYPWNPAKPVHTFWDLGLRDATSIWFGQETEAGGAINWIDYEEGNNVSLVEWCKLVRDKPYAYGVHAGPHDLERREYSNKKSYKSIALEHGIDFEVVPDIGLRPGIDSVKVFLPRCNFNLSTTSQGWDCLSNYRREYNDKLRVFMDRPLHDWASHGSDAFRMASIAWPDNYHTDYVHRFTVKRALG
jgi:phage terminase large subunit